MAWRRICLKLSGEAFGGGAGEGFDVAAAERIAREVAAQAAAGVAVGIVLGGGNWLRGRELDGTGIGRACADTMGMIATVMNALAFQEVLERVGCEARVLSALAVGGVAEPFARRTALRHLEAGRVLLLAGGTGHPFFTTDSAAALRAAELGLEVLMKATRVDGVFTGDPERDPDARHLPSLRYLDVLNRGLRVMDATAVTLCMENRIPILVFNLAVEGNLARAVRGEPIGTRIEG